MAMSLGRLKNVRGIRGVVYRLGQLQTRTAFAARGAANYARLRFEKSGTRPQVAAVVVGRNDDYMSDFAERLIATIEWNTRYFIDEVVFVEWNPPADRELLSHKLAQRFECLRAYVVPPEVHQEVCQNPRLQLLEYHAKNVGLRRARSPWIMATNADAALGLDAVRHLLHAELADDKIWTAERVDIPWREGRQHSIGLVNSLRYRRVIPYNRFGTGEFCLASRQLWRRIRGYDESLVKHRIGCDARGTAQMMAFGASSKRAGTVLHLSHPSSCVEGIRPHHGLAAPHEEGVPYTNDADWGLGHYREVPLGERVWRLEPPAGDGGASGQ
jgi:hypothetical protein